MGGSGTSFHGSAEKQQKVLKGTFGRGNSIKRRTLPFEKLEIQQLAVELRSRGVALGNLKETKKDLVPELKKVLRGIKRVPILLFHNPVQDLHHISLERYEITMVECFRRATMSSEN